MAVTSDMLFIVLAEEEMKEQGIRSSMDMTTEEFHTIVDAVFSKISLLQREGSGKFSEADMEEDDDQLRNFFLGMYLRKTVILGNIVKV